jgi:hypothetical protein
VTNSATKGESLEKCAARIQNFWEKYFRTM